MVPESGIAIDREGHNTCEKACCTQHALLTYEILLSSLYYSVRV